MARRPALLVIAGNNLIKKLVDFGLVVLDCIAVHQMSKFLMASYGFGSAAMKNTIKFLVTKPYKAPD